MKTTVQISSVRNFVETDNALLVTIDVTASVPVFKKNEDGEKELSSSRSLSMGLSELMRILVTDDWISQIIPILPQKVSSKDAAELLSEVIQRVKGASLTIVKEEVLNDDGKLISFGETKYTLQINQISKRIIEKKLLGE